MVTMLTSKYVSSILHYVNYLFYHIITANYNVNIITNNFMYIYRLGIRGDNQRKKGYRIVSSCKFSFLQRWAFREWIRGSISLPYYPGFYS